LFVEIEVGLVEIIADEKEVGVAGGGELFIQMRKQRTGHRR
jgi:hypothetical protein